MNDEPPPCIDIRYDRQQKLVAGKLRFRISQNQVEEWFATFNRHPDYELGFDELWDLTEAEHIELPTGAMRSVVSKEAKARSVDGSAKAAIIVTSPLLIGLARMYQTFSEIEGTKLEIELFETLESAREWLGLPAEFDFNELPEGLKI